MQRVDIPHVAEYTARLLARNLPALNDVQNGAYAGSGKAPPKNALRVWALLGDMARLDPALKFLLNDWQAHPTSLGARMAFRSALVTNLTADRERGREGANYAGKLNDLGGYPPKPTGGRGGRGDIKSHHAGGKKGGSGGRHSLWGDATTGGEVHTGGRGDRWMGLDEAPPEMSPESDDDGDGGGWELEPPNRGGVRHPRRKERRILNVDLRRDRAAEAVMELEPATDYLLRINIGERQRDSLLAGGPDLGLLLETVAPETGGHWVELLLFSDDFSLSQPRGWLYLPKHGPSWTCACQPGGKHTCRKTQRENHLFLPVRTPDAAGALELRLAVYYKNNLLQSVRLTAEPGRQVAAHTDYSLVPRLSGLDALPRRSFNILTNENPDGTHRVVVKGAQESLFQIHMNETGMLAITRGLRDAMFAVQYVEKGRKKKKVPVFDEANAKPKEALIRDLETFARLGLQLWNMLFPDQEERKRARQALEKATSIQISRIAGSEFVFPWSWIYDIGLEENVKPELCQTLKDWDGTSPILPAGVKSCPHHPHSLNTLCPFGFWGYRYGIDQPPSLKAGQEAKYKIKTKTPMQLVIGRSRELDSQISQDHMQDLKGILSGALVLDCPEWEQVKTELKRSELELVYFYCHGEHRDLPTGFSNVTNLLVGTGQRIAPGDIQTWQDYVWEAEHWKKISPLVFINGCHTADVSLDTPVNFVDMFTQAYASGVIGTEATISQRIASEAAKEIFQNFVGERQKLGEAMRNMRLHLLSKGNMLGLVYTAYCSADLILG